MCVVCEREPLGIDRLDDPTLKELTELIDSRHAGLPDVRHHDEQPGEWLVC